MHNWYISDDKLEFNSRRITRIIPETLKLEWLNSKNKLTILGESTDNVHKLALFVMSCTSHFKRVTVVINDEEEANNLQLILEKCKCFDVDVLHAIGALFVGRDTPSGEIGCFEVLDRYYVTGENYCSEPYETSAEAMRFSQTQYKIGSEAEYEVTSMPTPVEVLCTNNKW